MCSLDNKNNRKMCVAENPQAGSSNFTSYLIKGVLYFYFLRAVLVNNYNTPERFLGIELVASRLIFPLPIHYRSKIFFIF